MRKRITEIILVVLLIIVSVVFAYYYGTQKGKSSGPAAPQITEGPEEPELIPSPTISPIPSPTIVPATNIPAGWEAYANQNFGFEISYPPSYQALTDQENLYGWPNGVVLIYGGGQSYDLVIEHWDTQAEYKNKYQNQTNVTIKKIGNIYITLLNANFDAEVDEIIETFKSL